ncbi:MAG: PD-(D/E)XK nuclease family protein [Nanoarchaeota archaeon]|nr:PD-(D/E)XK nuclease family protein [Nanoarchaeota archaeon]MBU1855309.1 PD-(D/E)XK nuclease family protein [Nanoarchaeota archaeon]
MVRVESPSSINTYKQCPRKYYYHYIEELPTTPSIHLIRGKIVHEVLENFYEIDSKINSEDALRLHLFWLLEKTWSEHYSELLELNMDERKLKSYYDESKMMLQNWFSRFKKKLRVQLKNGSTFKKAVKHLTPIREMEFTSDNFKVRGFMDVVFERGDNTVILDYKTSKKSDITKEYRLQLGIYALLYEEEKGKRPDLVGIDFLKYSEILISVDDKLVEEAKKEIKYMHTKTITNNKHDYPKKTSPLCRWSSGQCDYYEKCFRQ